ncbi:hypothetical protein [Mesorhizobium sp.]|uniref:hypothetical protein n=1 Tax=Mesorhizobium sp. TaxID=1871066 RepID=UPI00257B1906|nr:hypothetical protein [Mesorhizobium sp.]
MLVAARQSQAPIVQHTHNFGNGAELQECLEHKLKPFLNGKIRIFDDHPARIARQAYWQHESKLAALGLGKQTSRQTAADRMQLEL